MDKIKEANLQKLMRSADKVNSSNILNVFNNYVDKIKYLSLDCFDTLIWRKTAMPHDVFFACQDQPTFKEFGITSSIRIGAEGKARQLNALRHGSGEINLFDIYREASPGILNEKLEALAEEELEVESKLCYAFAPLVELIRHAHQNGIKIIIVSDIYFNENQLRKILKMVLPPDILPLIDKIFCSSEHQTGKSDQLFLKVLQSIGCSPEKVLHIGDNISADYIAPRNFKINSLLFVQFDELVNDLLRLQSTSAQIIDPNIRSTIPLYAPFRGLLATKNFSTDNPEKFIGYASLGQMMYAFAQFLCLEINQLEQAGKNPKVLFLMRDAYLPFMACEAYLGKQLGKCVRISRFASYAASFCTPEDIDTYLIEIGDTNRFRDIARQLLLPEKVLNPIMNIVENSANPLQDFLRLIRRKDTVRIIIEKSAQYRSRLLTHLKKEVGIAPGDTIVLVDLGYSGTTQRRLTPVFNTLNVDVVGRYLLSLRVPGWEHNRRGLIDPSLCDDKAIQTMVFYIILIEQLCTSNEKSVIDYDDQGNAIYSEVAMSDQQHEKLKRIQSECIDFIKDAKNFFQQTGVSISDVMIRQIAMTELTRLLFFATESELSYLQSFQAEMNLGTQDILRVFDPDQGLIGLRRRGMLYMEKPSKVTRTNYPAELRFASTELVLSLIAQHRFGLDLKLKDMALRREVLQVIFKNNTETHKTSVDSIATHDGYFAIWLPANLQFVILLGEKFQWLQIESAELILMESFINQNEAGNSLDAFKYMSFYQMDEKGKNIFELQSDQSALIMTPDHRLPTKDFVLRIVFRPIVKRIKQSSNACLHV